VLSSLRAGRRTSSVLPPPGRSRVHRHFGSGQCDKPCSCLNGGHLKLGRGVTRFRERAGESNQCAEDALSVFGQHRL